MVLSYVVVWDKYERELFKPWSLRRKIVGERIIKVKLSIYTYYLEKLFLQSHTCSTLYYYFSLSLLTYLKVSSIASICRTEVNHVFGSSSVKLLAKSAHEMDVHPHAKDHCFSKISIWKAKKGEDLSSYGYFYQVDLYEMISWWICHEKIKFKTTTNWNQMDSFR